MQSQRLLLIRHAAAAHAAADRDRPLTEQGARAASALGSWLARAGFVPDRALVSPAVRAAQTWQRVGESLAPALRATVDERIYDNTVEAVLTAVRETPVDVRTLAVVGHNPSIGEFAAALDDGSGDPLAGHRLNAGFPAGAVAVFTVVTPFAGLAPGGATLSDFRVPTG